MNSAVAGLLPRIRAGFGTGAPMGDFPDEMPIEEALGVLEDNPAAATVSDLQWVAEDSASSQRLGHVTMSSRLADQG